MGEYYIDFNGNLTVSLSSSKRIVKIREDLTKLLPGVAVHFLGYREMTDSNRLNFIGNIGIAEHCCLLNLMHE